MAPIMVPRELQQRVTVLANERGLTQAGIIEQALGALLHRERMEAARDAIPSPLPSDYLSEARMWQALSVRSLRDH